MALFEDGIQEQLDAFLETMQQMVHQYNELPDSNQIIYSYGLTLPSDTAENTITELIALPNKRIYK